MVHALGRGMRMLVAGLAPEEIVVVGELTRQWRRFGPAIESEVAMVLPGGHPPHVRPAEGILARLRGTVALGWQKHFGPLASPQAFAEKGSRQIRSLAGWKCFQAKRWGAWSLGPVIYLDWRG